MSEWAIIQQNKPVFARTASLHIVMSLGYMWNVTNWYTQEQYNQLSNAQPVPWQNIQVQVKLDDTTVFDSHVGDLTEITHTFADSVQLQQHQLTMNISGFDDQHHPEYNGHTGGVLLKIHSICIEGLNLDRVILTHGKYVLDDQSVNVAGNLAGGNGTYSLPFTTPIYSWLMLHSQMILNKKYQ